MEKKKPIIANILQKWNDLSSARKRTVLTAVMFAVAALLIVIALIIGIASCAGAKQTPDAAEAVAPIPILLRAPQNPERQAAAVDAQTGENETQENLPELNEPEEPQNTADPAEPAASESAYQTLKKHDKGEAVTQLQSRLMDLG